MTAVALQQWHTWRACACASASAGGNTLSGTASEVGSLKAGIAALTLPVRDGVRLNDTIPYRHTKEQQQQTGGCPSNRKQSSSFRLIHLPVLSCKPKLGTPPVTQTTYARLEHAQLRVSRGMIQGAYNYTQPLAL